MAYRQCIRCPRRRAGRRVARVSRHQEFRCRQCSRVVRNTAYSWLAKNRPKAVVFTDDLSAAEQQELEHEGPHGTRIETPEEIALLKADAEDGQHALAQLPAQFREVIVLREINQLNYRDIAEITNVPIGTVMSRLSRGRQLLITLLGDREYKL